MNCIAKILFSLVTAVCIFTIAISGVSAADAASVVLGEDVTLHGTNPFRGPVYFYIAGPNFPLTHMKEDGNKLAAYGRNWEITIDTSKIRSNSGKRPDIGTYTIYISVTDGASSVSELDSSFTTVPLSLTAPGVFIQTAAPTPKKTAAPTPEQTPSAVPTPEETPASPILSGLIFAGFGAAAYIGLRMKLQ